MRREPNSDRAQRATPKTYALPPLAPYVRCKCGRCRACIDNAKWDRVFAKFETKEPDQRGVYQSAINDM